MHYLLSTRYGGILTDAAAVPDDGKVIFTFSGEDVDSVCVGGHFYPVVEGRAVVPTDCLLGHIPISAHRLADKTRFPCDSLRRIELEGKPHLTLAPEELGERLPLLCAALDAVSSRVEALALGVEQLRSRIDAPALCFGLGAGTGKAAVSAAL